MDPLQVNNVCRLCMCGQPSLNIYHNKLNNKIEILCNLQIYQNDGLPEYICVTCASSLENAFDFKSKCRESDKLLRESLRINLDMIKKEEIDTVPSKESLKEEYETTDRSSSEREYSTNFSDIVKVTMSKNKIKKCKKIIHAKKLRCSINKRIESVEYPKQCTFCSRILKTAQAFKLHLRTHSGKAFICNVCSKEFNSRSKLSVHKSIHNERKFVCEICSSLFKTTRDVQRHVRFVHGKITTKCNICNKIVASNRSLLMHMNIHTKSQTFQCDYCQREFLYKSQLKEHIRRHTGERPYKCKFCDSCFISSGYKREHERIHTGEKPFCCPVCGKAFYQLSNMKSHFRHNHKGVEFDYVSTKTGKMCKI